jgi:small subunit ribosomal protein S8
MDTLANLLSILKNASLVSKEFVEIPYSKLSEVVLRVMLDNGFVKNVKVFKLKDSSIKMLHVDLEKMSDGKSKISSASRVSRPGRRIYRTSDKLKIVKSGYGLGIVSTSAGVMSVKDAKKRNLGGEVICEVY